jgi:hypothetical protein
MLRSKSKQPKYTVGLFNNIVEYETKHKIDDSRPLSMAVQRKVEHHGGKLNSHDRIIQEAMAETKHDMAPPKVVDEEP